MKRSIATRHGDGGQTKLIYGAEVSKADWQVEAYGTIDELNSFLGLARSRCAIESISAELEQLQRETFIVGAELATPAAEQAKLKARVDGAMLTHWDDIVVRIEEMPGVFGDWALPGATECGAAIDVARSVARRAERCAVRWHQNGGDLSADLLRYLNRISDVLWLLGRQYEIESGENGRLRADRSESITI